MSDSSFKRKLEDKVNEFQKKIGDFQDYAKREIERTRENTEINLKLVIMKELKQFSYDNHLVCAPDKKSILYCDDCKDFTEAFIQYYKRKRR